MEISRIKSESSYEERSAAEAAAYKSAAGCLSTSAASQDNNCSWLRQDRRQMFLELRAALVDLVSGWFLAGFWHDIRKLLMNENRTTRVQRTT